MYPLNILITSLTVNILGSWPDDLFLFGSDQTVLLYEQFEGKSAAAAAVMQSMNRDSESRDV